MCMCDTASHLRLIGEIAPSFEADTTQGKIKFRQLNCELLGLSIDSTFSHIAWLQPSASTTQAVRAVFLIDPESKVRAILYYPLSGGRNFQERLLVALQTSDKYGVATPADWQPGEEVIVPPPGSCGAAMTTTSNPKF